MFERDFNGEKRGSNDQCKMSSRFEWGEDTMNYKNVDLTKKNTYGSEKIEKKLFKK